MKEILLIADLIELLKSSEIKDYGSILKSCRLKSNDFEQFSSWNSKRYTRNCIEINDQFELLLLCWNPGDKTPIHSHGGQKCWILQLEGEIEELRCLKDNLRPNEALKQTLKAGQISYMDDTLGYHILQNSSQHNSMSIHLYSSPIVACDFYDSSENKFVSKELCYDTIHTKEPASNY